MKKRWNATLKKACALLLVLVMVLGYIPGNVLTVRAEDAAHNNLAVKVADPATVDAWKTHFPANSTEYAGGVWTDKSVFEDAADDAIEKLLNENKNNRVGVVFYSGSRYTDVLMPLDRYSTTRDSDFLAAIQANNTYYRGYVNSYFTASTNDQLQAAFDSIVEEILLQSAYYPTHVEGDDFNQGGFLEFRDYIGENMEVKAVKGVALCDQLYTGANFARTVKYGMKFFKDHTGKKDVTFDAGEFSFALYQGDTLIETVENDADGKFAFQTLTFDNVGAYHYTVKEVKGGSADVIYDTTEYAVTVEVSKEDDFALTATKTVKAVVSNETVEGITFTNKEKPVIPDPDPDPIKVELDVLKELKNYTNKKVDLSKFRFELYDVNNDRVQKELSANSKGKVTFALNFSYSDVGKVFRFILSEVDTEVSGVTYSTKAYKIGIKISESNGKLVAAVWVDGERVDPDEFVFKFTNVLRDPGDPWTPKDDNVSPDTGDEGTFRWIALLTIGCVGFLLTLIRSMTRKRQRR